jgi:hypothetical protein
MAPRESQEQTQIISNANGRPAAKAPPIINANAESKFVSAWTSCLDMALLRRAPTGIARRPRMNEKDARWGKVVTTIECWCCPEPEWCEAESLWLRKD